MAAFCSSPRVHSFGEMTKVLNRSAVYLSGLQKRFELPTLEGSAYSDAYVEFLRGIIALRTFDISEETLRDLWQLEKKSCSNSSMWIQPARALGFWIRAVRPHIPNADCSSPTTIWARPSTAARCRPV